MADVVPRRVERDGQQVDGHVRHQPKGRLGRHPPVPARRDPDVVGVQPRLEGPADEDTAGRQRHAEPAELVVERPVERRQGGSDRPPLVRRRGRPTLRTVPFDAGHRPLQELGLGVGRDRVQAQRLHQQAVDGREVGHDVGAGPALGRGRPLPLLLAQLGGEPAQSFGRFAVGVGGRLRRAGGRGQQGRLDAGRRRLGLDRPEQLDDAAELGHLGRAGVALGKVGFDGGHLLGLARVEDVGAQQVLQVAVRDRM